MSDVRNDLACATPLVYITPQRHSADEYRVSDCAAYVIMYGTPANLTLEDFSKKEILPWPTWKF
jgi:hypothetical protein